jgi:thiosulfate dehydrogenase [quinone] large subunit
MESITLGRGSMIAITVLRILVGWHFFYEGLTKLTAPSWTAAGYLKQARGPFGEMFRGIAADPIMLANADLVTMWGLTIVGLLLILGLFTRLASVAGIGFILLFYFATPPFIGYFYTVPSEGSYLIVNKNLVEAAALGVIFMTRSGLFAGVDRIIHGLIPGRRARLATA